MASDVETCGIFAIESSIHVLVVLANNKTPMYNKRSVFEYTVTYWQEFLNLTKMQ